MKLRNIQLGIKDKLLILFFIFILIFYGTLLVLFFNTQKMMEVSEQIVSKNNQISALAKVMYESLLTMDANDKKYKLLERETYREYFIEGQINFESSLAKLLALETTGYQVDSGWKDLAESYGRYIRYTQEQEKTAEALQQAWAPEELVNQWLQAISDSRLANDKHIEAALVDINSRGKRSVRNGMIGMGVTILAGLMAVLIIAKAILHPLQILKHALKNISSEKGAEEIDIKSNDEFGDLAIAYNDMSRQLKEEEDLRSDFIATLSHEIRTPLASIRESVNMILEGVFGNINEKQAKFLDIAKSEIIRINELLNHLLQTSRLDSESRRVTPVLIDPNKLALDVSRGIIPSARAKNVAMKLYKITDPPVLIGVKKELQQVLFNIIENAVKFSPKGGEVIISLSLNAAKDMIVYRVSDNGPGIPEKEQSLIFSKYYRARNARNHMDGVGLGLSISKRIMQFHGGEIYVKNNAERGCSFYCSLPCEITNNGREEKSAQIM